MIFHYCIVADVMIRSNLTDYNSVVIIVNNIIIILVKGKYVVIAN